MKYEFKTTIEVPVIVEITGVYAGCRATSTDPGCSPEVDFLVYVVNDKGERELLQDCLINQNVDVLYDDCIEHLPDMLDSYVGYHAAVDNGLLQHRRSRK